MSEVLRAELGPIASLHVLAWVGNARLVLDGVQRAGSELPVELPADVAAAFRGYLDEWEAAAIATDPFRWSAEVPVDHARHLAVYMFGVLSLDDEVWERYGLPYAPPEADAFYRNLVDAVTEGLAAADAEVGPSLRASWPVPDEEESRIVRPRPEPRQRVLRVVVVDDTPDVRLLFEMALNIDGRFEVVGTAPDGAAAIARCEELQPDGVLLDVMMPVMDGLTALPRIREACPEARIVILSADDHPSLIDRAMASGADAYVTKSASLDEAISALLAGDD